MDIGLDKAAKAAVDEAAAKGPELATNVIDPEAKVLIDHFVGKLKEMIVGRKITITIE